MEGANEFLLLRIDRDYRLAARLKVGDRRGDVLELRVAVGMFVSLTRLAVALQAVVYVAQQVGHLLPTDLKVLPLQFGGQSSHTLAGPA